MVKDILLSFRDNFKEKTSNPFLGSYLFVWLIRNWELIYSLFNFDSTHNLNYKINFVKNYYTDNTFIEGVLFNVLITFIVLILTYIVLNISRAIVNLSEKQIKPWVYKKTDSKSIILKSTYEKVRNERDDLQYRLDKERESKSKLENRIKNLEEEILQNINKSVDEKNPKNNIENQTISTDKSKAIYEKLKDGNLLEEFSSFAVMCRKGLYVKDDYEYADKFLELGLAKFVKESSNDWSRIYSLTELGNDILIIKNE